MSGNEQDGLRIRAANGETLAIECAWHGGNGAGTPAQDPVIVLLHEGLGSVSQWGDFPAALAEATGCRVFVYSRPGYGKSGPVAGPYDRNYLSREATAVLPAVLATAGINRPILFGHSDGATIALLHAAAFPDAVRAIIIEAPHVFVEDVTIAGLTSIAAAARETSLIERLGRYHADPAGVFWRWNDIWLDPGFRDWTITTEIRAIRCPVLAIQGEGDEYATLGQIDAIADAVPGPVEQLILADCRHTPHRDQRSAILNATARFIAPVRASAAPA